jgi:hypothetical protein
MSIAHTIGMTRERTIRRSSVLDAPADLVWAAVRTPQAFRAVTKGLLDWRPSRGRTAPWREGEEATGWLLLGGVLPFSRHRLRIAELDDRGRVLRSDESGGLIRSWRHDITVEPLGGGRSRYTDVIHLDAGAFTPLVAAFAWAFYRERQRRWRALAAVLSGTDSARHAVALGWLRRHEAAFNAGDVTGLTADYTDDVVLEAHLGGHRVDLTGAEVPEALAQATAAGHQTRVSRVAASGDLVAAQIDDEDGTPYMVSFWELRDGCIARDVSIVVARAAGEPVSPTP